MNLKVTKQVNVDFYDTKYISINAKQYDRASRYILVTCYNQGTIMPISNYNYYAFVRYRKADELGVFNKCQITNDGKILIELTEQMLAVAGRCYADLVILDNNPVETLDNPITENTGKLIELDNDYIVSTMTFTINVIETALDNVEIESSYEYNALNDLLIKATEDYTYVMSACKVSEDNAKASEKKVNNKVIEASNSALMSKSYAVGGTNTRTGENVDNAQYYYDQVKALSGSLDGSFTPMGTIEFAQLQSVEKNVGYVYHISDSFISDSTFKNGAGTFYPFGTNVYYTADGYWDCFVSKDIMSDINVNDDDEGNVVISFKSDDSSAVITYQEYNALKQTIDTLQKQVQALEGQTVLEVVE